MGYRVDMSDVQTNDFEALPAGTYICYITDGEERVTSEESPKIPNEPYLRMEFTIAEGQEHAGRKFWGNAYLQPSSNLLWTLKGLLVATGEFTSEQFDAGDIDFRLTDDEDGEGPALIGTLIKVKVDRKKSDYNGEYQNNVKGYKRVTEEEADNLDLLPG